MTTPSPPPPSELPHSTYHQNNLLSEDSPPHDPNAWRKIKPFPSGARKRPIHFLPAGSTPTTFPPRPASSGKDVSAMYLQLVGLAPPPPEPEPEGEGKCSTCGLPLSAGHELTLVHQASLTHSFPPHHLPRGNVGLKILQEAGWDPEARMGLGAEGQGGRFPVKAVLKRDRRGVGVRGKRGVREVVVERPVGVKEARRREVEGKRRREGLMRELRGVDLGALMGEGEAEGLR